ncbi:hypothetical protein Pfo_025878 [Paulownia fortunei]|nr:hypothetical protein Pfo_025878 [Paulownia fortunei]
MINRSLALTYLYLLIYITLSSGVILYNKWVLSPTYFNFPFPITLTMLHMGFSGAAAFFLVRIFKVVSPVKMTFSIYATCVIPISAFFASSLWYVWYHCLLAYISVAFIQMLKALMPAATFIVAVLCGTDKLRWDVFLNMVLVSVGVVISSYGEIHFNVIGMVYQVTGIFVEALRLVLTQVLLQKKGLSLNPITSSYYIAPCSFIFLFVPWYFLEMRGMEVSQIQTGAVTVRVAGVLKDWILIALSTVVFPESTITGLNITGYAIGIMHLSLSTPSILQFYIFGSHLIENPESIPEIITKDWKLEKKSSDLYRPDSTIDDDDGDDGSVSKGNSSSFDFVLDEEAPLIPLSRLSHIGRTQQSNRNA